MLDERCVREWLADHVVSSHIADDPVDATYHLLAEHAVLSRHDSPTYVAHAFDTAAGGFCYIDKGSAITV